MFFLFIKIYSLLHLHRLYEWFDSKLFFISLIYSEFQSWLNYGLVLDPPWYQVGLMLSCFNKLPWTLNREGSTWSLAELSNPPTTAEVRCENFPSSGVTDCSKLTKPGSQLLEHTRKETSLHDDTSQNVVIIICDVLERLPL